MVKRILSVLLVAVLMLSVLAACGGAKQEETTAAGTTAAGETTAVVTEALKPVTLELYTHSYEPMVNVLKKLNEEYPKQFPHVKINYNIIPDDQFATKVPILFNSNEAVDVINLHSNFIFDYQQYFADPPAYVLEDIEKNIPASFRLAKESWGKTFGYMYPDIMIMLVNKTMYAEAGLSYPKTWDELVAANKAMTKKVKVDGQDVQKMGANLWIAAGDHTNTNILYGQVLGGMGYTTTDAEGNIKMNTPEAAEALKLYKDVVHRDDNMLLSFAAGNNATTFGMRWVIPILRQIAVPGFEWEVQPLPVDKNGVAHPTSGTQMQIVNKNRPEDNQKESWKYLNWLHNDENNYILEKEGGFGDWRTSTIEKYSKEDPIFAAMVTQINTVQPLTTVKEQAQFVRIFGENIEAYIFDQVATPEEALSKAQAEYDKAIDK